MNYVESIKIFAESLISNNASELDIDNDLEKYIKLLYEIAKESSDEITDELSYGLDGFSQINLAASSVKDKNRTKQFIRAALSATQDLLATQECVNIVYVGSGPFASIILPILASYSPEQVKVSLIDIDPISLKVAQSIIHNLGFEEHIVAYLNANASSLQLQNNDADIVISTVMQQALYHDDQLSILNNLFGQLDEGAIMIPEMIKVDLVYYNSTRSKTDIESKNTYNIIGNAITIDSVYLKSEPNLYSLSQFRLDHDQIKKHDTLALVTEIKLYQNIHLAHNESVPTLPTTLALTSQITSDHKTITIEYNAQSSRKFDYYFL